MVDISEYKVGIILSIEDCGKSAGKPLKSCHVNVGDPTNPLTVVTSAPNVREGSRVAVAVAGSTVLTSEGDEMVVKKTAVGGVMSEGMLCDSRMLGWQGGAEGIAVQIPESFEIGACPPSSKPRLQEAEEPTPSNALDSGSCLFEKKLSKEEKKRIAEEKRKAKKALKEAKT